MSIAAASEVQGMSMLTVARPQVHGTDNRTVATADGAGNRNDDSSNTRGAGNGHTVSSNTRDARNGHAYSGNTMLASAGLSDDSLLAHAPTKQDLSQRVVDLVSASVIQVLSLEENLTPSPILAAG